MKIRMLLLCALLLGARPCLAQPVYLNPSATVEARVDAAAGQDAPTIVLMIAGRPRVMGAVADKADAIVFAGLPGFSGGEALAELMAGDFSPSGRLAFSYPSHPGHLTAHHHKPSEKSTVKWPFGHGLSYGSYVYRNLSLSRDKVVAGEPLTASVEVSLKEGQYGEETVLWYLTDDYGRLLAP